VTWNPGNIVWQSTDPDGSKWVVLEGDKDAPGKTFTYAFLVPAGHWEHHSHNQDARVAVISGALKVAVGRKLDKEGAKTYPVGSVLFVPANVEHTMGQRLTQSVSVLLWVRGRLINDQEMHHH
jgi:quercetin dioxygenase-like cupin family protein